MAHSARSPPARRDGRGAPALTGAEEKDKKTVFVPGRQHEVTLLWQHEPFPLILAGSSTLPIVDSLGSLIQSSGLCMGGQGSTATWQWPSQKKSKLWYSGIKESVLQSLGAASDSEVRIQPLALTWSSCFSYFVLGIKKGWMVNSEDGPGANGKGQDRADRKTVPSAALYLLPQSLLHLQAS